MTTSRNIYDRETKRNLTYNLGQKIQNILDEREISQSELGRRSGNSRSVINNFLKGTRNPSLLTAYSISKALNISLDELVAETINYTTEPYQPNQKIDFLLNLEKLLSISNYYSNDYLTLTQTDKKTILRLIYAYLNVNKSGNPRKSKTTNKKGDLTHASSNRSSQI